MKKIPTLFKRTYDGPRIKGITDEVTPGMEWVLAGEGLREYLRTHNIEGLVFWKDGEPQCKIKRSDFGFKWPDKTLRVEF